MALAQFTLYKCYGTNAATETNTSWNPTFLNADLHSTNTGTYPVAVPDSGYNYSYETWLRLKCTTAPDNAVANIKVWYQTDAPATGVDIYIGTNASGVTPVATASSYATTDATDYDDSGTALTWGTPQANDQITAVDQYTDYLIAQLRVGTTAGQGNLTTQILHIQYDES